MCLIGARVFSEEKVEKGHSKQKDKQVKALSHESLL